MIWYAAWISAHRGPSLIQRAHQMLNWKCCRKMRTWMSVCVYLILNLIIITLHVMGSAKWNGRQKKSTSNNDDVDDGDGDDYDQCFCLWICYLMQHKRPLNHLYVYRHTTHTSHCRLRIVNVFIALQRLQRTTQLVFNHSTKCEHFVRCAHQTNENVSACHAVWDMCYKILICFSSFFHFQQTVLAMLSVRVHVLSCGKLFWLF